MANKEALRELQSRLAERLLAARTQPSGRSWLAVECGSRGFLFALKEAGEIFALAPVTPVPHAQAWFLGVANLRGHLHGVVDLARFLGIKSADRPHEAVREQARLVAFNAASEINCALWVDRLAGLKNEHELTVRARAPESGPTPAFVGQIYSDQGGFLWQELHLGELASDDTFLSITATATA
ncbi:MAG: chemotaxis protein CheW [Pseudorhodobacter sp.]|nr:chemotaxis protein CheW [Rhizobacter sp.]